MNNAQVSRNGNTTEPDNHEPFYLHPPDENKNQSSPGPESVYDSFFTNPMTELQHLQTKHQQTKKRKDGSDDPDKDVVNGNKNTPQTNGNSNSFYLHDPNTPVDDRVNELFRDVTKCNGCIKEDTNGYDSIRKHSKKNAYQNGHKDTNNNKYNTKRKDNRNKRDMAAVPARKSSQKGKVQEQ